ncbi:hypothetical protein [Neobacillus drentensis]|uniref:hypothetical protein n=1 Tax=Neobacillus drentensis TaxID=220684 RepID=UPI002FFF3C76
MEQKARDSCGKSGSRVTQQARQAPRRLPDRPRGAERLERKSTGKFIRAFHKANPMIETYPMC